MLVENSARSSFVEAVKRTFDGAHPCGVCQQIKAGKKEEQKTPAAKGFVKIDLIVEPNRIALFPPPGQQDGHAVHREGDGRRAAPLLRPPRLV